MGQEHNTVRHRIINLDDAREVEYWIHRLGITRSELRRLAETMNKPVSVETLDIPTPKLK